MSRTARPYRLADKAACLALFDSNTPRFFDGTERADFDGWLEASQGAYLVIEQAGRIVACGGHAIEPDGETATLCWGMAEAAQHGSGLGRMLTEARLAAAKATPGVRRVQLSTSQHTEGFYRRFGFETVKATPDGYAPGIDKVDMLLALPEG